MHQPAVAIRRSAHAINRAATRIDVRSLNAVGAQDRYRSIHRISFSNGSQVDAHAVRVELDLIRRYQFDFFVADARARLCLLRGCGSRAACKRRLPQIHHWPYADVELSLREA